MVTMQHYEGIDSLFCVLSGLAVTRRVQKDRKTRNANQRRKSLAQRQKWFFRIHGKCGQEDVGAMHDKLWDEQHVEVFPSNAPYVEHQAFDRNLFSRSSTVRRV